jgi:carbon monoxide dehydrogenase subunit G
MLIDGQFTVAAPPEALMRHLFDARLMAGCLPGCESLEALDDDRYRTVVAVAMAGVKARFELEVAITKREPLAVWATTRGEEGGNASQLQADNRITLESVEQGTSVRYESEVTVTGRLGRFALGMMKKKAQALGEEFAGNLQAKLAEVGGAEHALAAAGSTELPLPLAGEGGGEGERASSAFADADPPASWWQTFLR